MARVKPVKPLQRGAASGEIYNALRDEILTLRLATGFPLDETSFSKRFSVSRSPIREALNRLLAGRLVETLPNRSTIVAPVDLRSFAPFIQALDVHQRLATLLAAQNRWVRCYLAVSPPCRRRIRACCAACLPDFRHLSGRDHPGRLAIHRTRSAELPPQNCNRASSSISTKLQPDSLHEVCY